MQKRLQSRSLRNPNPCPRRSRTWADVDAKDLLSAVDNNANWLTYGRTYDAQRFSPLKNINKKNVKRLVPRWVFQTGVLGGFECTPLVIDGVMYVSTPWNHVFAIDALTGRTVWHYQRELPDNMSVCCGPVNRGLAAWRDRLYMTTLDAHLLCFERGRHRRSFRPDLGSQDGRLQR